MSTNMGEGFEQHDQPGEIFPPVDPIDYAVDQLALEREGHKEEHLRLGDESVRKSLTKFARYIGCEVTTGTRVMRSWDYARSIADPEYKGHIVGRIRYTRIKCSRAQLADLMRTIRDVLLVARIVRLWADRGQYRISITWREEPV